ncbi:trehalose-phosphatase [Thalassotalea euphylliae]|uniref:Trehalose 6-phosphate phosphatase n=1 Tax=Thalassotalea euphylliae TaxID=1655234 RepID=A0A3E0TM42_9GAMM|nr:trehalose-phosphatase [Thalassotalea euphylliae]REL25340.1 trehalose-phosphatase [Thalassotalea euphylliae]
MKQLLSSHFQRVLPLDQTHYQVFSDFDGTLVNIASAPHKIYVHDYIPELLADLDLNCQFCLVSGRAIKDLNTFLPITDFNVYGCHGAEFSAKGESYSRDQKVNAALQAVAIMLGDILFAFPGVLIEEKPHSIAIHYRNLVGDVELLKTKLNDILNCYPEQLRLQAGKKVFEFCLRHICKGDAISQQIKREAQSKGGVNKVKRLFIGDDDTDESGFQYINAIDGISIRVGRNVQSAAQYYVNDVYEVHTLLHYLSQSNSEMSWAS